MAVAGLGVGKSTECISYLVFWGILNEAVGRKYILRDN
jgi:hypothetical protein